MIDKGIAFVCEGETEQIFYKGLIDWCCATLPNVVDYQSICDEFGEKRYVITTKKQKVLVRFKIVSSIT